MLTIIAQIVFVTLLMSAFMAYTMYVDMKEARAAGRTIHPLFTRNAK